MRKLFGLACLPFLLVLALIASGPMPAAAATLDETLARIAQDNFAETQTAIDELAVSDAPHAAAILEALRDRKLQFDPSGGVFYAGPGGKLFDARTGSEAASP